MTLASWVPGPPLAVPFVHALEDTPLLVVCDSERDLEVLILNHMRQKTKWNMGLRASSKDPDDLCAEICR